MQGVANNQGGPTSILTILYRILYSLPGVWRGGLVLWVLVGRLVGERDRREIRYIIK
jgi:hypothetical protein